MLDKLFYVFVLTFVIFTTVGSAGLTDNVDEPLNVGEGSGELEWERGTVDVDGVPFIGSPNAPVKMVVYCDIFGPYCNQQWKETMPRLVEDYVAEGDVQLFYKHLPVVGGTQPGIASECIQRESSEAYYEFIDSHFNQFESMRTLYQENENGYDGLIKDWAVELGVDSDQFENCYDNQETQSILQSHSSEAQNLGATATPWNFVNGESLRGAQPFTAFQQVIDDQLENSESQKIGESIGELSEDQINLPNPDIKDDSDSDKGQEEENGSEEDNQDDKEIEDGEEGPGFLHNINESIEIGRGSGELAWEDGTINVDGVPFLGSSDAPVKMVTYCDMVGPYCNQLFSEVIPRLTENYIANGQVQFFYKHNPVVDGHKASEALECVDDQSLDGYWRFLEGNYIHYTVLQQLYEEYPAEYNQSVEKWANELSINKSQFMTCYNDGDNSETISDHSNEAESLDATATPWTFINGISVRGAQEYNSFRDIIQTQINASDSSTVGEVVGEYAVSMEKMPDPYDASNEDKQEDEDRDEEDRENEDNEPVEEPTYTLEFDQGWNMISVPVEMSADLITDECSIQPYEEKTVWHYRGEWTHPSTLDPYKGYYMYADQECSINLNDDPEPVTNVDLEAGWNMISGAGQLQSVQGDCTFSEYKNETIWHLKDGEWTHPNALEMDNGYFVYTQQECELGIGAPPVPGGS